MVMELFVEELLAIVSWPVAEPVVVGSNVSVTFNDWPGLRVAGTLTDAIEKPLPVTEIEFTVTAAVPVDVSVTVCVVALFTMTAPNEMFVAFTVKVGVPAFSCSETEAEPLVVAAEIEAD